MNSSVADRGYIRFRAADGTEHGGLCWVVEAGAAEVLVTFRGQPARIPSDRLLSLERLDHEANGRRRASLLASD